MQKMEFTYNSRILDWCTERHGWSSSIVARAKSLLSATWRATL